MNKKFDFSWEFKNFKIRTIHEDFNDKNSPIKKDCPIELLKYSDEKHNFYITIAYFKLNDEGYELKSVGNRLFKHISKYEIADVWEQLQAAQKMLDIYFEASRDC